MMLSVIRPAALSRSTDSLQGTSRSTDLSLFPLPLVNPFEAKKVGNCNEHCGNYKALLYFHATR